MAEKNVTKPVGSMAPAGLERIRKATGHSFVDLERLDRALTHASARHRTGTDYERLEFLGDRVLGLCVADMLFKLYPEAPEGEMSVRLNALVNADALAEISDEIGLADLIRTGSDVRDIQSDRQKNMRADVVESLIAALYLEGGLDAARTFIAMHWSARAKAAAILRRDAKTELQEWAHKLHATTPDYEITGRDGPDHAPEFTVEVTVGKLPPVQAIGASKRQAEQAAAAAMLVREGVWDGDD
ncbi:MAG: ribonuclease III [Pseudomonadota bacterium]